MSDDASEDDAGKAFVDLLLEGGLVRKADLSDCAKAAEERSLPLTDVLVEQGYLTEYQVRKLSKRVSHLPLVCHHCKGKVSVRKEDYRGAVFCSSCEKKISLEDGTASFGEALVIDHPRRLADRVLSKLLVSEGLLEKSKVKKHLSRASGSFPKRPLDKYLVDQGVLQAEQLRPIRSRCEKMLARKYAFLERLRSDVELGRFLLSLGLVSLNRLNQCCVDQAEKTSTGEYVPLRELLAETGEITDYQLKVVLPREFDRVSRRTKTLARRRPEVEPEERPELLESEVEVMEELRSDSALITLSLHEGEEESAERPVEPEEPAPARKPERAGTTPGKKEPAPARKTEPVAAKKKMYDPTEFNPGDLMRAYIEKTYGRPSQRKPGKK
ncbi:MAG: hypothetical protein HY720_17445 [Planctomycetes bacterium]|nr:hypothetical protein [Planctomycetota bacterium]